MSKIYLLQMGHPDQSQWGTFAVTESILVAKSWALSMPGYRDYQAVPIVNNVDTAVDVQKHPQKYK